ncbi:hypothetical protein IW262DRAFT_1300202 [Armillaria fumosa]|nr:hypothetical protein IW262DRAFT_1300202 [Armillaria fumosa]
MLQTPTCRTPRIPKMGRYMPVKLPWVAQRYRRIMQVAEELLHFFLPSYVESGFTTPSAKTVTRWRIARKKKQLEQPIEIKFGIAVGCCEVCSTSTYSAHIVWLGFVFSSSASILAAAFNIVVRTTMLNYDGMIEERKLLLMFYVNYLTWNEIRVQPLPPYPSQDRTDIVLNDGSNRVKGVDTAYGERAGEAKHAASGERD